MSRGGMGIGLVLGGFAAGAMAGCASERPVVRASRGSLAEAGDRPRPSRESHHADPPLATRTSPASDRPLPPADERRLEGAYGGRRAVAVLEGEASYYGDSLSGNHTANGERYDPRAFTAAHRTLPFNTVVRVVRTDTRATVYVRITDRGPFGRRGRILDLSRAAAERLHMIRSGVAEVRAEIVEYGPARRGGR